VCPGLKNGAGESGRLLIICYCSQHLLKKYIHKFYLAVKRREEKGGWKIVARHQCNAAPPVLIDGKALRATSSNAKEQAGFLNVFSNELGIVIDQVPTGKRGGEKTAIKQVLKAELDLTGKKEANGFLRPQYKYHRT